MKKVYLMGDSIRLIGYGLKVPQMLENEFEVSQPEENCRWSSSLFRIAFDKGELLDTMDIIHFNSGEWDVSDILGDGPFTGPDEYVKTMKRLGKFLLTKADTVIFATTTPVLEGHIHNDNETIRKYNELIVPEYEKMGIIINDLYSVVDSDREKYVRSDDRIHLTEEGIDVCAKQVCEVLRKYK